MKIIGVRTKPYGHSEFIVEMNQSELTIIATGSTYPNFEGDFSKICDVPIAKNFEHAMRVIDRCEQAKKLPAQLESIADMLKFVVPKLDEVLDIEAVEE